MPNIIVIQQHSPFSSSHGREALDMILALAAVEHNVSVLFRGDAVYQLLATEQHADFNLKAYPRSFKLFALYDVEQLYVCRQALTERGIAPSTLTIDVQLLDAKQQAALLSQQDQVINS